jgi:hypothetical protein
VVAKGELLGLKRLRIDEKGIFNVFPEASLNTEVPSRLKLDSLRVFTGGLFHHSLGGLTVGKLYLTLTDGFVVNAYGKVDVSGLSIQVRIDIISLFIVTVYGSRQLACVHTKEHGMKLRLKCKENFWRIHCCRFSATTGWKCFI